MAEKKQEETGRKLLPFGERLMEIRYRLDDPRVKASMLRIQAKATGHKIARR